MGAILELFSSRESDKAWHGGCLALAELGKGRWQEHNGCGVYYYILYHNEQVDELLQKILLISLFICTI